MKKLRERLDGGGSELSGEELDELPSQAHKKRLTIPAAKVILSGMLFGLYFRLYRLQRQSTGSGRYQE
jgi:hypothetical protein